MQHLDDSLLLMLRSCSNLPSPPAVATKIIELSSCETSCLADMIEFISLDPALSAKLLRMANSPLYAKQRKIENLCQAITLFGLDGTLNIALSFSLMQSASDNKKSGLDYHFYWKRSLASAMICQEIIQHLDASLKDSAFLSGLLQDIGMLALDKVKPDLYLGCDKQTDHQAVYEYEQKILQVDHSAVGAWMLEEWHLPANIIEPILNSHMQAPNTQQPQSNVSKALACASILADVFLAPKDEIHTALTRSIQRVEPILDLERETLHSILESVSSNYNELAKMFDIHLENSRMCEFISEQAKEVLVLRNLTKIKETECLQETAKQLESKTEQLEELNRRDGLTQLFNRRHFDESIQTEFNNTVKFRWPLGLIFIDIDHFKKINDTLGHNAGDEVLCHAASTLLDCTRDSDIVCRYGGEEFTVLLPGTNREGVETICERIIYAFREKTIKISSGEMINITVSAGAFVYNSVDKSIQDAYELVRRADQATYQSKNNGRDQYCLVEEQAGSTVKKLAG